MFFSVPAIKNAALIREGRANMNPTNNGLIAAPVVRATPVQTRTAAIHHLKASAYRVEPLTVQLTQHEARAGGGIFDPARHPPSIEGQQART